MEDPGGVAGAICENPASDAIHPLNAPSAVARLPGIATIGCDILAVQHIRDALASDVCDELAARYETT